MILPTKHLDTSQSLLGTGALVLGYLRSPNTVSQLWGKVRQGPSGPSFERFVLSLDFLFAIGAIELKSGLLRRSKT